MYTNDHDFLATPENLRRNLESISDWLDIQCIYNNDGKYMFLKTCKTSTIFILEVLAELAPVDVQWALINLDPVHQQRADNILWQETKLWKSETL